MEATLKRKRFNFRGSLCMPYGVFMALFVVLPLVLIIYYAFTDANGHFDLNNWKVVFQSVENWKVIGTTFLIAFSTTIICILIAYPIAYILSNKKFNKNAVLVYIFLLPMWINFVIRTNALKDLLNGITDLLFNVKLTSTHPYISIVIGSVYYYLPYAILPLYNQMLKMDKNQIEAASDLGANPFQVFIKTIIPMTIPGIVSACMMTFMPTMSSYVIADKMSENSKMIIGTLIQNYFLKSTDKIAMHVGAVLSLVMLTIVGVTLLIEKLLTGKNASRKEGVW